MARCIENGRAHRMHGYPGLLLVLASGAEEGHALTATGLVLAVPHCLYPFCPGGHFRMVWPLISWIAYLALMLAG